MIDPNGSLELGIGGITGVRVPERTPPDRDEKVDVPDSGGSKVVPVEYEVR